MQQHGEITNFIIMNNLEPTPQQTASLRKSAHVFFYGTVGLCLVLSFVCAKIAVPDYRPIVSTTVSRSLNTAYQPSTTRSVLLTYSSQITSTLSLTAGQSGSISLQISPDNVTYTTVATTTNNNTGTLIVGLNTSATQSGTLVGVIPPSYYYKLVSTGTSTFGSLQGQETLL